MTKKECPHCGKQYSVKGMGTHIWRKHTEKGKNWTGNNDGYKKGTRNAWNKGLTKETDERIKKYSETNHKKFQSGENVSYFKGKKHTEKTKEKIRQARINYLKKNPDKVPYLLNHYSKGKSYPEQYFIEVFKKENIDLQYHKQIGLYQLDFYNEKNKFYVEIDGEQHYSDKRIVESDKRRTKYLKNIGWRFLRIRWSLWQKMTFDEKHKIVN